MTTMHKKQRKLIRKMIIEPQTTPETMDELKKLADEFKLTKEELLKKIGIDEAIPYNIFKKKEAERGWKTYIKMLTISYWKNRSVVDANLHIANLIHMELNNGMFRTFIVAEHNHGFYYLNKRYVFDLKMRYYDLDYEMHGYDYHEDFALPFKRNFPATDIKRTMEKSDSMAGFEVSYAVNPSVLERFVNSSAIEMALNAGEIRQRLDLIKVLVIVILVEASFLVLAGGFAIYKIYKAVVP